MKQICCTILLFFAFAGSHAQDFADYFQNKTLRVDYIFTGNAERQNIYLDELSQLPSWAGRQHHLSELPLEGNGQIIVKDLATQQTIYKTSFSSLFHEWLSTDEAKETAKGFENTFLLPFPKQPAEVEITLYSPRKEVMARYKHLVRPDDILIHQRGVSHVTPHRYLLRNGNEKDCIDVAILAEGYTDKEMGLFYQDAESACESLFSHEPFRSMKSIHNALAGIPYEHIIILSNTDVYGGGGIYNSYTLTTAHHPMFKPVVVHEFGHSFAGLADEYFYENDTMTDTYPLDVEPWEQNISTRVNFSSKWEDLLPAGTPIPTPANKWEKFPIGVYEGGGYSAKGIYRPAHNCRMKTNEYKEFCPVCQRAIRRIIEFYVP